MRQRKHLCRFRVLPIQKNEWRISIGKRKATKLLWVKATRGIATDDTATHHHCAGLVNQANESPQRILPPWFCRDNRLRKANALAHLRCYALNIILYLGTSNKVHRI